MFWTNPMRICLPSFGLPPQVVAFFSFKLSRARMPIDLRMMVEITGNHILSTAKHMMRPKNMDFIPRMTPYVQSSDLRMTSDIETICIYISGNDSPDVIIICRKNHRISIVLYISHRSLYILF